MCDDLISRQAVKDMIKNHKSDFSTEKDYRTARACVNAVPPAQPGWVPWDSGKFPEESETYTVTAYDGVTNRVTYAKYQKRLKRWELTGAREYWRVLAWMPWPEPYREDNQC